MRLRNRIKYIYLKVIKTQDTPHRIALGFAIGIFYGLFPFVGIIFMLVTAIIFRANKITALIGCFVTNTWMSAVLLLPSVKIGSKIFGLDWKIVWQDMLRYLKMADIKGIFKATSLNVIIPALTGFLVIAFSMAAISYFISLLVVLKYKNRKKKQLIPRDQS